MPVASPPIIASTSPSQALHALRRHRKLRRMGNVEWFDAFYKVYVMALFGGGAAAWLSGLIGDGEVSATTAADVARVGPAVMGLAAVAACAAGLRSGARGGPLALEAADVTHVMLAPVPRRTALARPTVQRARSAIFGGMVGCALIGLLVARRLPGTPAAWSLGGALFGATLAMLWIGAALIAHAWRMRLWACTLVGVVGLAWQGAAAYSSLGGRDRIPGVANLAGGLALWGWRERPIELVATAVAVALLAIGWTGIGRTSLDALARRSGLVAQLRFAVTMQDLRTVMLLRRQLNQEHTRQRPWLVFDGRAGGARVGAVVRRRGLRSVLRFPASKLVRMAALSAVAGASLGVAARGTTAGVLVGGLVLFVLGLDALEPLSQEIDHGNLTDQLPTERGLVLAHHLLAPAMSLVPCAVVMAAAAVAVSGSPTKALAPAAILALPAALAGVCGSVVSVVRDAPDPLAGSRQEAFVPPEMAGFTTAIRTLWPLAVSLIGPLLTLTVQSALNNGRPLPAAALRAAVGCILVVAATAWWVRIRDRVRAKFRAFIDEGRAYTNKSWS